jgi:hypothetical protein
MRPFLTVLMDAQMGQAGIVGKQQGLYFFIITSCALPSYILSALSVAGID